MWRAARVAGAGLLVVGPAAQIALWWLYVTEQENPMRGWWMRKAVAHGHPRGAHDNGSEKGGSEQR